MLIPTIKTFKLGNDTVKLETGRIARQADGAILVSINNDVTILVTVVAEKKASENQDFFPLSVHYVEKYYSSGKIPGSFLKREGRPSDSETLTSRLIDRPLRPLFPEGFLNEVQIICTVLSSNKNTDPDIASLIGASAALAISGIPFNGPIGAVRVGFNQELGYILNPNYKDLKKSDLDMVVAGTEKAVLMVESEAQELTEDLMLGAVLFAHQEMQVIIANIKEFAQEHKKEELFWEKPFQNQSLIEEMRNVFFNDISNAYTITVKQERYRALDDIRLKVIEYFGEKDIGEKEILSIFEDIQYHLVRDNILNGKPRIDGRDIHTVRPLHIEAGVLDKTHGSALFTRGETQAIVVTTLGSQKDEQLLEDLSGERKEHFIFHYNFPPYSVGECGRIGSVGRREIGHGRLARRGIAPVMPKHKNFPYTIRVVSEITESNGSSSMASVCGASLSLMDAGVPLKAPVAGIAMGLVLKGDKFAVLTDILGDEDHLGDMDFKVAGTANGITALQMDIKIEGINEEIMETALQSALKARLNILSQMNQILPNARTELNSNAPTIITMKINPDKIKDVIGKGGAMIRSICEEAGAAVDIDDSGQIKIFGETKQAALNAKMRVESVTLEAEVGKIYVGKVARITDFGAFVNILPNIDGLLHVSMIKNERVEKVTDVLSQDQVIKVKVLDVDNKGRIKLSMKDVEQD